jgi:IclR family acetate operon transcriptional repressor
MAQRTQSVDRALRILEVIAEAGTPLSLSEIGARAGLHLSTTHRLLATLSQRQFVEQERETGHYRVGAGAFRVGRSFLEELNLSPRLRPVLVQLAARTGETANLVIRSGVEAVYVDHVIGTQVAKLFTEVGQRVPLHCTAVGKVLLAFAPDMADLLAHLQLPRFTPRTITSHPALQRELAEVRARGYAVDREEHEVGVACIAAPVHAAAGLMAAAVGISGPSGRILPRAVELGRQVKALAQTASALLAGAGAARRAARRGGRPPADPAAAC